MEEVHFGSRYTSSPQETAKSAVVSIAGSPKMPVENRPGAGASGYWEVNAVQKLRTVYVAIDQFEQEYEIGMVVSEVQGWKAKGFFEFTDGGSAVCKAKPGPKQTEEAVLDVLYLVDVIELVGWPYNWTILQDGAYEGFNERD